MEQESMNERMHELLIESGLQAYYDAQEAQIKKFAELIVRDCLAQVDKMRDSFEADGESKEALGAEWIGYAIEKHFGV